MKKDTGLAENVALLFTLIFLFLANKSVVSKVLVDVMAEALSVYFFPGKMYLYKTARTSRPYLPDLLISDIIISTGLIFVIAGMYLPIGYVIKVMNLINIGYMVYFALQESKTKMDKSTYWGVITNHFVMLFLLILTPDIDPLWNS